MAVYVADTHALLWYLSGDKNLTSAARSAFDEATSGSSQIIVPAIVIAELVRLCEKGGIDTHISQIITTLRSRPGFLLTALTPEIATGIQPLMTLNDIHDRLIVAEAIASGAILITRDKVITDSGLVPVLW